MDWLPIISGAIGIALGIGVVYARYSKIKTALITLVDAIEDDKITPEEMRGIIADVKAIFIK